MSHDMTICGMQVRRNSKLRTYLPVPDTSTSIPVTIINGKEDGPTLLITAGIHGGEYPGIAAAMELGRDVSPEDVAGCLISVSYTHLNARFPIPSTPAFPLSKSADNLRIFPGKGIP